MQSAAGADSQTYEEGEGLLELGDLFLGQRVSLLATVSKPFVCLFSSGEREGERSRGGNVMPPPAQWLNRGVEKWRGTAAEEKKSKQAADGPFWKARVIARINQWGCGRLLCWLLKGASCAGIGVDRDRLCRRVGLALVGFIRGRRTLKLPSSKWRGPIVGKLELGGGGMPPLW